MARNKTNQQRKAAKLKEAVRKQGSGEKLSRKEKGLIRTEENRQKEARGQGFTALSAVTDAFMFATTAISKKDSLRADRKLRGQQLVENARRSDRDAESIVESGKERATEIKRRGKQDASSLRARLASQGVQVDFGTGADAVDDIINISGKDASTIKTNAFRRAHNKRLESSDLRSQAKLDRIASKKEEDDTLLTGGLQAVRSLAGGVQQADGFSAFEFTK